MIYTLSLNPAMDLHLSVKRLDYGEIYKTYNQHAFAGGKGINVSLCLKNLGINSIALGFTGGFVGDFLKKELDQKKIKHDFVDIEGTNRINVKIDGVKEIQLNGVGPKISKAEFQKLLKKLNKIKHNDYLIISGNIPNSISLDTLTKKINELSRKGVKIVVDTTGEALLKFLKCKPILIKPNRAEAEEVLGEKLDNTEHLEKGAFKLHKLGAKNVIISLGKNGALLYDGDEWHHAKSIKIDTQTTVGAGDTLLAAFISQYSKNKNVDACLKYAVIASAATCKLGYIANKNDIDLLIKRNK